jgi:hypothetical protein
MIRRISRRTRRDTTILGPLEYSALSTRQADDVLKLIVDCHSKAVDAQVVDGLIEGLRTTNPDVRFRIEATLVYVAGADFSETPIDAALKAWSPTKDDSPAIVDTNATHWRQWYAVATKH